MKRTAAVLAIIVMGAWILFAAQGNSPGPKIVFDSTTKDFGTVTEGEPLKHVFKFTNKGSATLEIAKVEPG